MFKSKTVESILSNFTTMIKELQVIEDKQNEVVGGIDSKIQDLQIDRINAEFEKERAKKVRQKIEEIVK